MKFHSELRYCDIKEVDKIVITQDMLKQIEQFFCLNLVPNFIRYNFESINIEFLLDEKINVYVENDNENNATITYFKNGEKLFSFVLEYVFDIAYSVDYIVEYAEILEYDKTAEELILFVLKWYPVVIFYIQSHLGGYDNKMKKQTFFVNTKNSKLDIK